MKMPSVMLLGIRKMSEQKEITVVDIGVDLSGLKITSISLRAIKRRFEMDEVCRILQAHDNMLAACKDTVLVYDNLGKDYRIMDGIIDNVRTAIAEVEEIA